MTDKSDRQEGDFGAYNNFKTRIGTLFCNVVNGVNGVISSKCGDLTIEREHNGSITLSKRAAELLTGIIQSPTRDGAEGAGLPSNDGRSPLFNSTAPPKPAPSAMRNLSALQQEALAMASRIDFGADLGPEGFDVRRRTVKLLREFGALSAPVPPADGATEDALTKLLDETWPDGHRAAARKILSRFSISLAVTAEAVARWYVGAQNDGLFIINAEPRPSNDDQWHDRPNGPTVVLNVTELPAAKVQKIVDVMNGLASPTVRKDREAVARALAVTMHGDDVEWRGFLTKADAFAVALPVQSGAGERDLVTAATRMRDMLTADGDPPSIFIPSDIVDAGGTNEFTKVFDALATAIRVYSNPRICDCDLACANHPCVCERAAHEG